MWKIDSQWRAKLMREIKRKSIHLTGLFVPICILLLGQFYTAILIALALLAAIILEAGRLKGKVSLPAVRDHEQEKVAGYIYYILGSLLTVVLFQPMIAVTAMLMLSLGDAMSGLAGSVLENSNVRGRNERWQVKPAPIVACMFLTCLAIGFLSSSITGLSFPVYLAGAIGATIADSVALVFYHRNLDDNLTIPLFAGALMSAAVLIA